MKRFEEVDQLKAKLDAHRPIPPEVFQTIAEKLRIDWTYHTNRIEGGPLTYRETAFFVRTGLTSKGRSLEAYLEYRGHLDALDYLEELVRDREELSERVIKEFHSLLLRGVESIEVVNERGERIKKRIYPGSYKSENNHVVKLDGTIHRFCEHTQVPGEMERLVAWCEEHRERLHQVELATEMHHRLVAIHPFADGNGRLTRLVMNLILMQAGYVPAIIRDEDREEYYTSLDAADEGNIEPLITMVEREVARTLRLMLDVVEGREALTYDDLSKKLEKFDSSLIALEEREKEMRISRQECITRVAIYVMDGLQAFIERMRTRRITLAKNNGYLTTLVLGGTYEEKTTPSQTQALITQALILKEINRLGMAGHSHLLQKYQRHLDKEKLDWVVATLTEAGQIFLYTPTKRGGKELLPGVHSAGARQYASEEEHARRMLELPEEQRRRKKAIPTLPQEPDEERMGRLYSSEHFSHGIAELFSIVPDKDSEVRGCFVYLDAASDAKKYFPDLNKLCFPVFASKHKVHMLSVPLVVEEAVRYGGDRIQYSTDIAKEADMIEGDFDLADWSLGEVDQFLIQSIGRYINKIEEIVAKRKRMEREK